MKRALIRFWRWLTYWPVPCSGCNGTGVCAGPGAKFPHSCCGDCLRRRVSWKDVPENFDGPTAMRTFHPLIGDGVMWRRPWSRKQVLKPSKETRHG